MNQQIKRSEGLCCSLAGFAEPALARDAVRHDDGMTSSSSHASTGLYSAAICAIGTEPHAMQRRCIKTALGDVTSPHCTYRYLDVCYRNYSTVQYSTVPWDSGGPRLKVHHAT